MGVLPHFVVTPCTLLHLGVSDTLVKNLEWDPGLPNLGCVLAKGMFSKHLVWILSPTMVI